MGANVKQSNLKLTAAGPALAAAMDRQQGAALKPAMAQAARAWAAALVAKLEGLADAVRAVDGATSAEPKDGATRAGGELIAGALDREVLNEIAIDLHRLTETAAGLIAPDAGAELPDLLGEARRVGALLAAQ